MKKLDKKLQILRNKEKRLNKGALLRFREDLKPKSLSEIIYHLINRDNGNYYSNSYYHGKEYTYTVSTGRKSGNYDSRSIEDAYRLAKHYISTIKYEQVHKIFDLLSNGNIINGDFCITCRRVVYSRCYVDDLLKRIKEKIKDFDIKIR